MFKYLLFTAKIFIKNILGRNLSDIDLKRCRERGAVLNFLSEYNQVYNRKIKIFDLKDPPQPDIICHDRRTHENIGIEVVTVYLNDDQAKNIWSQARKNVRGSTKTYIPIQEPDKWYCQRLQEAVSKKLKKKYECNGKVWLLIDWNYPLSDRCTMDNVEECLIGINFSSGPFSQIWLVDKRPLRELKNCRKYNIRLLWEFGNTHFS